MTDTNIGLMNSLPVNGAPFSIARPQQDMHPNDALPYGHELDQCHRAAVI